MRKAIGRLALCGAALTLGVGALADTPSVIVDTFGNGLSWGVGGSGNNGGVVGYDPNSGSVVSPTDPTLAAYAAMPFTVNALPAGQSAVSGINIVFNILPSSTLGTSNIPSLRGAILRVPAGVTSLYASGITLVGSTFQFDTSGSNDPINNALGSGYTALIPALNLSAANITLAAGQNYLLLIEPKNGLGPTASDTLLAYGVWLARSENNVKRSSALLSTNYAMVKQATDTYVDSDNSDSFTLRPLTVANTTTPSYFGAQISVQAPANTGATVMGNIALEGVDDLTKINTAAAPLGTFHIEFRTPGTLTIVKDFPAVTLATTAGSANGKFTVSGVAPGTYDVWIKGGKNLAVLNSGVVISGTTGTVPDSLLGAGDSDNNNMVDVLDFGTLVNAYGTALVDNNGYDSTVDFNFDGRVDVLDFGLLVNEYGVTGPK